MRELDLIYNFVKACMLLDEFICGGDVILEDKDEVIARNGGHRRRHATVGQEADGATIAKPA